MFKHSKKNYWTAMFSRTGYELFEVINRLEVLPNKIICNKEVLTSNTCNGLLQLIEQNNISFVRTQKVPEVHIYDDFFQNKADQVITLHGWMRIIPPEICNKYEIYNGHPGLINKHPELKGKDPQLRAFNGGYFEIGTVIHRVVSEVDAGEILASTSITNTYDSVDVMSDVLREMSIALWCDVLVEKLK